MASSSPNPTDPPDPPTAPPPLKDLTIENITTNTNLINAQCPSPRLRYLLSRLVTHLHDFARETRLSTAEWSAALAFLIEAGQISSPQRNELILLSDILGLSLLVDAIDHPKPPGATEGTVLGPFHTHDAPTVADGGLLSRDDAGEPLLVVCCVRDLAGRALEGVRVDIWETDSSGHYDVQYASGKGQGQGKGKGEVGGRSVDGRGVMYSDARGGFWFRAIKPVSYPIPHDGPVGRFLGKMRRHPYRPAHMHFMLRKEGWDCLITALYVRGDPYESSDAVFGVKSSLIVDLQPLTDPEMAKKYDVPLGTLVLQHEFVLVSEEEAKELRERNSREAMEKLGMRVRWLDGLPVPDVD
ncbi:6-chlorohydroxyquinol-1,2-dioxygenase [Histoplasma ohiense]|nr:6-chlorohydroxyquinol-1,2-dioxygenase [Histoplasma ohiense (nom. inval.)]